MNRLVTLLIVVCVVLFIGGCRKKGDSSLSNAPVPRANLAASDSKPSPSPSPGGNPDRGPQVDKPAEHKGGSERNHGGGVRGDNKSGEKSGDKVAKGDKKQK